MRNVWIKKTADGRTGFLNTAVTTANTRLYLAPFFFKRTVCRLVYSKFFMYSNVLKDSLEKSSRIIDIIFGKQWGNNITINISQAPSQNGNTKKLRLIFRIWAGLYFFWQWVVGVQTLLWSPTLSAITTKDLLMHLLERRSLGDDGTPNPPPKHPRTQHWTLTFHLKPPVWLLDVTK